MSELDSKLYEILGDKTLSFGCYVFNEYKQIVKQVKKNEFLLNDGARYELIDGDSGIIGHEPTIEDLHRWMNERAKPMYQNACTMGIDGEWNVFYDSSKSLLSQSEETKLALINLIASHS